jgi:hypothetical protein
MSYTRETISHGASESYVVTREYLTAHGWELYEQPEEITERLKQVKKAKKKLKKDLKKIDRERERLLSSR